MPQNPTTPTFTNPEEWLKRQADPKPPLKRLTAFAKKRGLRITSTTGGQHNPGSAHPSGQALDFGTKELDPAYVDDVYRQAEALGFNYRDERQRPSGQKVWSGPHGHLEYTPAAEQFDKFTDPEEWLKKQQQSADSKFTNPEEWLKKQSDTQPRSDADLMPPVNVTGGKGVSSITLQANVPQTVNLGDEQASLTPEAQQPTPLPAPQPEEAPPILSIESEKAFTPEEFNQAEQQRLGQRKRQMLPNVRTLDLPYSERGSQATPEGNAPQATKLRIGARNWQDLSGARLTQAVIATMPRENQEAARYVFSLIPQDESNDIWTNGANIEETKVDGKSTGYAAIVGIPKWVDVGIEAYKQGGAAAAVKAVQERMKTEAEYTAAESAKRTARQSENQALTQNATAGVDDSLSGKSTAIDQNITAGFGEGANRFVGGLQGILAATAGRVGLDGVDRYLSEASENSYNRAAVADAIGSQSAKQADLSPVTSGVARAVGAAPMAIAEIMVPQAGALVELTKNANRPVDEALGHAFLTEMSGLGLQTLQTLGVGEAAGKIGGPALQVLARSVEGGGVNLLLSSPELLARYQHAQTPDERRAVLREAATTFVIGAIQPNLPRSLGGQGMPERGGAPVENRNPLGDALQEHDQLLRDFADHAEQNLDTLGSLQADPQVNRAAEVANQAGTAVAGLQAKQAKNQQQIQAGYMPPHKDVDAQLEAAAAAHEQTITNLDATVKAKLITLLSEAKPGAQPEPSAPEPRATEGGGFFSKFRRRDATEAPAYQVDDDGNLMEVPPSEASPAFTDPERWLSQQSEAGTTQPVPPINRAQRGEQGFRLIGKDPRTATPQAERVPIPATFSFAKIAKPINQVLANNAGRLKPGQAQELRTLLAEARTAKADGDYGRMLAVQSDVRELLTRPEWKILNGAGGALRVLSLGGEVSKIGRQGGIALVNDTRTWAKSLPAMAKSIGSEQGYHNVLAKIHSNPWAEISQKLGLDLETSHEITPGAERKLAGTENAISGAAEKVSGALTLGLIPALERGNKGGLDLLRITQFAKHAEAIVGKKNISFADITETPKAGEPREVGELREIAKLINITTGRANLGEKASAAADLLSFAATSPRLAASRFQFIDPSKALRLAYDGNTYAAKEMLRQQVRIAGLALLVAGGIYASGKAMGLSVSFDPDSGDFMKIKHGNDRWDILPGGLQSPVKLVAGVFKDHATMKQADAFAADAGKVATFLRYKESPLFSFGHDQGFNRLSIPRLHPYASTIEDEKGNKVSIGENAIGEKVTLRDSVIQRVVPLLWQSFTEAKKEQGWGAVAALVPEVIGWGAQTYTDRYARFSAPEEQNNKAFLKRDQRLVNGSVQEEPLPHFEQRKTRANNLYGEYLPRMQSLPTYQKADAALQQKMRESLAAKIREASYDEQPDRAKLYPQTIIQSILAGQKRQVEGKKKSAKRMW